MDEQLTYCRICTNREMDVNTGLLCGLTKSKPDFQNECSEFSLDQAEANYQKSRMDAAAREEEQEGGGFFGVEKQGIRKGVTGGIVMMVIAVIWFIGGYAAGIIFYYPPILFLIGVFAFAKGLFMKNLNGKDVGHAHHR